jgi:hypothetical protein
VGIEMQATVRVVALLVLLVALGLLILAQWTPALAFLPVGAVMLMWNGQYFSLGPPPGREDPRRPYE